MKIKHRTGVVLRCYGPRTGVESVDSKCGWVGDSGEAKVTPAGEETCPRCDGSTLPPARLIAKK
jgi:hypothetical protein